MAEDFQLSKRSSTTTRPRVDPGALGEVDPDMYPEPKDATNKIRGRHDMIEYIFGDQEFFVVKAFYFFFYSAFGSLFPLMGVYFKQMGMTARQCGVLVGCRPFVEFLSAPFWGGYADRSKKGKLLLIVSLSCWIIFTLPLGFLQPVASHCMKRNNSQYVLELPHNTKSLQSLKQFNNVTEKPETYVNISETVNGGKSPFVVINDAVTDFVYPVFTSVVYRLEDIQKSFFLMLLLVVIGEFFSAPAITLVDSAVIAMLGDNVDQYGHQRMYGSLGWGLSMFVLGIALDHSTQFKHHPCGQPGSAEKNYGICFFAFSIMMGFALACATQINFYYEDDEEKGEKSEKEPLSKEEDFDAMEQEVARQLNLPSLAPKSRESIRKPVITTQRKESQIPTVAKTEIFAQTTREIPEWVAVLNHFDNLKCASFLFVAWFMGFGIGLIFTFLFWHLQDYGGNPTLFGFASVINHISEIYAYFFSHRLIQRVGHVKVLCLGLAGNVVRFLYVSWLTNPWFVLPFELMQGITHAAVWAACCSYISHNTPPHLRNSAQGVLQGIHHGLGRGCGAVLGGAFVTDYGSAATFRGYGILCAVVLVVFIFINFYDFNSGKFVSDLPVSEDPHQVAEEGVHLAPHGVPSNPMPRVLSSSKLQDLSTTNSTQSYGSTNLDVPGGRGKFNPFLQPDDTTERATDDPSNPFGKPSLTNVYMQQPPPTNKTYNW